MSEHLERIKGSLSEIRTHVAAAQELEPQSPVRTMLEAIAREMEQIETALAAVYDDAFVDTADGLPLEEDEPPAHRDPADR
jgi:hypothetical protein